MTEQQKANVKAWIEALQSGKYQQGFGSLNRNGNYCCLGVLADINNIPTRKSVTSTTVGYDFLPWENNNESFTTIPDEWWLTHTGLSCMLKSQLIVMNDTDQKPFADIANRIESEMINNANSV